MEKMKKKIIMKFLKPSSKILNCQVSAGFNRATALTACLSKSKEIMLILKDKSILEKLLSDKLVSKEELLEAAKKPALTKMEPEFPFATNCGESLTGLGALMLKKKQSNNFINLNKLMIIDAQ